MAAEITEQRRFVLGKFVKNAAPGEDVVARILETRTAGKMPEARAASSEQLDQIADGIGQLFDLMVAVHEQDSTLNKAFDTLYGELNAYKNDFFYERLKPFVRAVLFAMDSVQSYSQEVAAFEKEGKMLDPTSVKSHVDHFAEEMMDALKLIELAPIEEQSGEFNPRLQRAVEIVPVPAQQDGEVVRVVRHGYSLGGTMLRPADVVVGKKA